MAGRTSDFRDESLADVLSDRSDQMFSANTSGQSDWRAVAERLDRNAPGWSYSVCDIEVVGAMAVAIGALTIDGVTREGIGSRTLGGRDAINRAEADAFVQAAMRFPELRDAEPGDIGMPNAGQSKEAVQSIEPTSQFPLDPVAASVGDMVTAKQLGIIRALAREGEINVEEECRNVLGCGTDELSKLAARSFIEYLGGPTQDLAHGTVRRVC